MCVCVGLEGRVGGAAAQCIKSHPLLVAVSMSVPKSSCVWGAPVLQPEVINARFLSLEDPRKLAVELLPFAKKGLQGGTSRVRPCRCASRPAL